MKALQLGLRLIFAIGALFLLSCRLEGAYKPKGMALIYGGSVYNSLIPVTSAPNLQGTANDAESMAELFQRKGYDVKLRIDDGSSYTPLVAGISDKNRAGTLAQLTLDIQTAIAQLSPGDNLVFYYAGHGGYLYEFLTPATNGFFSTDGFTEDYPGQLQASWLALYTSAFAQSTMPMSNPNEIKNRALSSDKLAQLLEAVPDYVHKIVIVDACRSGGLFGLGKELPSTRPDYGNPLSSFTSTFWDLYLKGGDGSRRVSPTDALVVTAAGLEFSYEDTVAQILRDATKSSLKHGVFTYFFLEGEKYADVNRDGYLTLSELYSYSKLRMSQYAWNSFMPRISGGAVDFLLYRND